MPRWLVALSLVGAVFATACSTSSIAPAPSPLASQFWRPISEPNILMQSDGLQQKLDFDLSQCRCGVYPANTARDEAIKFQSDKQRLAQTGVTVGADEEGKCEQRPSLVVTECMRHRGWEPTSCAGRVTLPGGGSLCAGAARAQ